MPVVDGFLQQFQRKAKLQRKWYSDTISFAVLHCTFLCLCPLLLSETVYCWPLVYTFPVCIVVSSRQHTWADRHSDMTTTQRVCSLYTAANAAGSLHQIYPTFRNCYKMWTAELQLFIKIYNNPQYLLQKHNLLAPASAASQQTPTASTVHTAECRCLIRPYTVATSLTRILLLDYFLWHLLNTGLIWYLIW